MTATAQALAAVTAAKKAPQWGQFATVRYLFRRRVPARMAEIAFQFEKRRKK